MKKSSILFSIIIPAYNEESCLAETLRAVHQFPPPSPYEIIVVDNNSTDSTAEIAFKHSAHVITSYDNTIAAVRNRGVENSNGHFLIFLDGDVKVTNDWHLGMPKVLEILRDTPLFVTGSRCLPPNNITWLNRYWFTLLSRHRGPYINSGHLITSRLLFDRINGFTESLKTAEDYDFCIKAHSIGAPVMSLDTIPVIHDGYPTNVIDFINRERWHGREDFITIQSFKESKVGWVAIFNLAVAITCLCLSFVLLEPSAIITYLALMYVLSIILSIVKFRITEPYIIFNTATIFFLYITGRSLAFLDRMYFGVKR